MNSRNTRLFATLVATTALLGSSTASSAETQRAEQSTTNIRLRDLDLTTPVGAYTLYREIISAANQICGSTRRRGAGIAGLANQKDAKQCREEAITGAVRTVDAKFGVDLEQLAGLKRSYAPAVAEVAER